jgi:hypothetical protein
MCAFEGWILLVLTRSVLRLAHGWVVVAAVFNDEHLP